MPYKRGNKWVGCVRKKGIRKHKVFQTKKAAQNWEIETRKKLTSSNMAIPTTYSIRMWVNEYLDYSQKFSVKTYKEKRSILGRFCQMINIERSITSITPDIALRYLNAQFKARGGNAANKDRKNLVAGWKWGQTFKGFGINPFMAVDKFPETRQSRYIPPEKDFWKVYEIAEKDKVLLLAYLHTAARRTELFQLRWDDVDFGNAQIRLWTRKRQDGTMEYDWLPMTDELFEALLTHKQNAVNEWVFPNPLTKEPYTHRDKWIKSLCKRAGVRYFGLHSIRHLTASILAGENIPANEIQSILRHKKLLTTEKYIHILQNTRTTMKVLEKRGNVLYVSRKKSDDFGTTTGRFKKG